MAILNFFGGTPRHPLAEAREAKRIYAELATRDPQSAIEEAAAWLESLASADELTLPLRVERLLQLDEAVVAQVRRCGREFLSHCGSNQEKRLWELNHDYWARLAAAYVDCLEQLRASGKDADALKPFRDLLPARALHAHAGLLKSWQFRQAPVAPGFWSLVGGIYLAAAVDKRATRSLTLYGGIPPSCIESEYLKILLFQAASMDKLPAVEVELAERLIAHFLPRFALTREVRPDNVYWVDAAKPLPPTRLAKLPEVTGSLRFFNGGEARLEVEQLVSRIDADRRVPADINLGGQYEAGIVVRVLRHLATCWASKPPMRGHVRHRLKSRLIVAHGMDAALAHLSGRATGVGGLEFWTVDDVSLGGMGALAVLGHADWIRIGVLIAIQPEHGANWLLGAVRRFSRLDPKQGSVGIETLSKNPRAVIADAGGLQTEAILLDVPEVGGYARMALPLGVLEDKVALVFPLDGMRARLHPRETLEEGADYVIARFFVQSFG